MKIEIDSKKVFINSGNNKEEIHPFWLRERINNEDALDKGNQQRLFDPNSINTNIDIEKIENEDGLLNLFFNDGTNYKIKEDQILNEYKSQNLDLFQLIKLTGIQILIIFKNLNLKMIFLKKKSCMIY